MQPVNNSGANQSFTALVDYVTVTANTKKPASVRIDFDGDGKTDIGVYNTFAGVWSIIRSSDGGNTVVNWGGPNWIPVE